MSKKIKQFILMIVTAITIYLFLGWYGWIGFLAGGLVMLFWLAIEDYKSND